MSSTQTHSNSNNNNSGAVLYGPINDPSLPPLDSMNLWHHIEFTQCIKSLSDRKINKLVSKFTPNEIKYILEHFDEHQRQQSDQLQRSMVPNVPPPTSNSSNNAANYKPNYNPMMRRIYGKINKFRSTPMKELTIKIQQPEGDECNDGVCIKPTKLTQISSELLAGVFSYLPYRETSKNARVCQHFLYSMSKWAPTAYHYVNLDQSLFLHLSRKSAHSIISHLTHIKHFKCSVMYRDASSGDSKSRHQWFMHLVRYIIYSNFHHLETIEIDFPYYRWYGDVDTNQTFLEMILDIAPAPFPKLNRIIWGNDMHQGDDNSTLRTKLIAKCPKIHTFDMSVLINWSDDNYDINPFLQTFELMPKLRNLRLNTPSVDLFDSTNNLPEFIANHFQRLESIQITSQINENTLPNPAPPAPPAPPANLAAPESKNDDPTGDEQSLTPLLEYVIAKCNEIKKKQNQQQSSEESQEEEKEGLNDDSDDSDDDDDDIEKPVSLLNPHHLPPGNISIRSLSIDFVSPKRFTNSNKSIDNVITKLFEVCPNLEAFQYRLSYSSRRSIDSVCAQYITQLKVNWFKILQKAIQIKMMWDSYHTIRPLKSISFESHYFDVHRVAMSLCILNIEVICQSNKYASYLDAINAFSVKLVEFETHHQWKHLSMLLRVISRLVTDHPIYDLSVSSGQYFKVHWNTTKDKPLGFESPGDYSSELISFIQNWENTWLRNVHIAFPASRGIDIDQANSIKQALVDAKGQNRSNVGICVLDRLKLGTENNKYLHFFFGCSPDGYGYCHYPGYRGSQYALVFNSDQII